VIIAPKKDERGKARIHPAQSDTATLPRFLPLGAMIRIRKTIKEY